MIVWIRRKLGLRVSSVTDLLKDGTDGGLVLPKRVKMYSQTHEQYQRSMMLRKIKEDLFHTVESLTGIFGHVIDQGNELDDVVIQSANLVDISKTLLDKSRPWWKRLFYRVFSCKCCCQGKTSTN